MGMVKIESQPYHHTMRHLWDALALWIFLAILLWSAIHIDVIMPQWRDNMLVFMRLFKKAMSLVILYLMGEEVCRLMVQQAVRRERIRR
jgi:hypothetical protein